VGRFCGRVQRRVFCAGVWVLSCAGGEQPGFSRLPARERAGHPASISTGENLLFCVELTVKMSAGLWSRREDLFLFMHCIYTKEVISGASNRAQSGGESVGQFCFLSGNCNEENLFYNLSGILVLPVVNLLTSFSMLCLSLFPLALCLLLGILHLHLKIQKENNSLISSVLWWLNALCRCM